MVKPFGPRFFTNKMISAAKRYHFASSEFVGVSLACHYGERETIKKGQDKRNAKDWKGMTLFFF